VLCSEIMKAVLAVLAIALFALANGEVSSGDCGTSCKWNIISENKTMIISGTGDMTDFEEDKAPWHGEFWRIFHVEIRDGITSIGTYAFSRLTDLMSVSIPASVAKVGCGAFNTCVKLKFLSYLGTKNPGPSSNCESFHHCSALPFVGVPATYSDSKFCANEDLCKSEACLEFQKDFNYCFKGRCVNDTFTVLKDPYASECEGRSTPCVEHKCDNTTGEVAEGLCASDSICYTNECKNKKQLMISMNTKSALQIDMVGVLSVVLDNITDAIFDYTNISVANYSTALIYDEHGYIKHAIYFVDDAKIANSIVTELKKEDHSEVLPGISGASILPPEKDAASKMGVALLSVIFALVFLLFSA